MRNCGKNYNLIRLMITPTGLPMGNLLFCRNGSMIKWNGTTGEVSTVEYDQRTRETLNGPTNCNTMASHDCL